MSFRWNMVYCFEISNCLFTYRFRRYSICGKIQGGQQCNFDAFLTKPVVANENIGKGSVA